MNNNKFTPLELLTIAIILAMLFWPVPVDSQNGPLHDLANAIFNFISIHPSLHFATYYIIEKASNIALFVPLGYIARKKLNGNAQALSLATLVSITAELAQKYVITNRVFAIDDIIANALGAVLGIAFYQLFNRAKATGRN